MEVKRILDPNLLDDLVATSTWVWEGVAITNENIDWIKSNLELTDKNTIYTCTGAMINKHYNLTDDNAYPADYPFIFVYDYYNVGKRIELGAQWFDVLMEDNLMNQALLEDMYEEE